MKKRLFIAINLPENIKQNLLSYQKKFKEIPGRWVKPKNIHITLIFLGYIEENKVGQIKSLIKQVVSKYKNFEIVLEKIVYGPTRHNKFDVGQVSKITPRMIWVTIQLNNILKNFQKDLEDAFFNNRILPKRENREFSPHITLCRFDAFKFKKLKNPPVINQKINLRFQIDSIDLMESKLSKIGAEYSIIEKFEL